MCLYMEDASYQPQSSSDSTIFCDCTWKTWCCSVEQRYYCDLDWWILLMKYLKISLVLILIFFSNLYYEVHILKAIFFIILIVTLSNFILDVGSSCNFWWLFSVRPLLMSYVVPKLSTQRKELIFILQINFTQFFWGFTLDNLSKTSFLSLSWTY